MCEKSCQVVEINGVKYVPQTQDGDIKLMILQSGFVYVGRVTYEGNKVIISNAYNVRRSGTTGGFGEIALNGPTKDSKLDFFGTVRCHELNIVNEVDCVQNNWISTIKG